MPLVPLNTVQAWYKQSSWVYRSFSYWFKNPLWDKKIPQGFSLCPYFWMAIASIFLRAFVGIIFAIRLAFKPFGGLLEVSDRFFAMFFKDVRFLGGTTFKGGVTLGLISTALYYAVKGCSMIMTDYMEIGMLDSLFMPIILGFTLLVCTFYYEATKNYPDRCKVEYYVRCLAGAFLTYGVVTRGVDFFDPLWYFTGGLWEMCCWVVGGICTNVWWFICQIPGWIATAAVVVWGWLVIAFYSVWKPVLLWGSVVAGFGLFAIIFDKKYLKSPERVEDKLVRDYVDIILNDFAVAACWLDKESGSDHRNRKFWKTYMRCVPEAVGLAYEIARRQGTITKNDERRAALAAINTWRFEEKLAEERRLERRKNCNVVTTKVEGVMKNVETPLLVAGTAVWKWSKFCFVQTWTFICLLWELAKAKKQGACPYLKFEQ